MKKYIYSKYKYYNANSRGKDVGDCVKRSLSLAFGMDYDDVSRELNKLKGYSVYNSLNTVNRFLKQYNLSFTSLGNSVCTVNEFCEKYPSGTYLLLTGDKKTVASGGVSHMVCIINGDIYDSWHSGEHFVSKYVKVPNGLSELSDVSAFDLEDELVAYLEDYLHKLQVKKMPYVEVESIEMYSNVGTREGRILIRFKFIEDVFSNVYELYWVKVNKTIRKSFNFVVNPAFDLTTNLDKLKVKLKQRIYDYFYNHIWKPVDDAQKALKIEANPRYRGDLRNLLKCPEWARPLITMFDDNYWGDGTYSVYMDPLPGDPRDPDGQSDVYFRADTLRELKDNFEAYRSDYARIDYDY